MDIDWLEAEIDRLARLPRAEVGVPMFLVPENLADSTPVSGGAGGAELGRAFDAAVHGLEARRGPLTPEDLARIVEVLAEHDMVDGPFTACDVERVP